MQKKTIQVDGISINIQPINDIDYISLTDLARKSAKNKPAVTLQSWLRNTNTILFLDAWEKVHNPNYKVSQLAYFIMDATNQRLQISAKQWTNDMNGIGLIAKAGRNGGTYAHKDVAINFCYWLSPPFQVYFIKEFQRLKEEEYLNKNLKWHISKLTDLVDDARNILDLIPGQDPKNNRLKSNEDKD